MVAEGDGCVAQEGRRRAAAAQAAHAFRWASPWVRPATRGRAAQRRHAEGCSLACVAHARFHRGKHQRIECPSRGGAATDELATCVISGLATADNCNVCASACRTHTPLSRLRSRLSSRSGRPLSRVGDADPTTSVSGYQITTHNNGLPLGLTTGRSVLSGVCVRQAEAHTLQLSAVGEPADEHRSVQLVHPQISTRHPAWEGHSMRWCLPR